MALKDDAGLVKQFAMLDIQRYQNVAVGNTVPSAESLPGAAGHERRVGRFERGHRLA